MCDTAVNSPKRPMYHIFACYTTAGGWSARTSDTNQFLAVLFYGTIVVRGIQTAGRTDIDEWVTKYKIQYQESYFTKWLTYQDPPGMEKVQKFEPLVYLFHDLIKHYFWYLNLL